MPSKYRARIVLLVLALLVLYAVLPHLGDFSASWSALQDAKAGLVAIALLFVLLTYAFASGMYCLLAMHRLHLGRTLAVEIASAFTNRLLPAGVGGLTLNVEYLRHARHTTAQALTVAGATNGLGIVGHMLLLLAVAIGSRGTVAAQVRLHVGTDVWVLVIIGVMLIAVVNVLVFRRLREYVRQLGSGILRSILAYRCRPRKLAVALLCSVLLTSSYVLVLQFSAMAVGMQLSLWSMFVVFTVGHIAGTATPTPGGLGGAEAGLVAGLVSYGTDAPVALATALLYRLLTYWLPLLPGVAAFFAIRNRYLHA